MSATRLPQSKKENQAGAVQPQSEVEIKARRHNQFRGFRVQRTLRTLHQGRERLSQRVVRDTLRKGGEPLHTAALAIGYVLMVLAVLCIPAMIAALIKTLFLD